MLPGLINSTRKPLPPPRRLLHANLNLAMQSQQQSQWCWAAVATSVSLFYSPGSGWTQCSVVNAELGQTTCCQCGCTPACNQPWYLDLALTRTVNLASWAAGTVAYPVIRSQIAARRPLGARIGWSGGGGHFLVLDGYNSAGGQYLSIRDPFYGSSVYTYASFQSGYQTTGSWTHSYYTQP
jgi:hypothetical protein